MNVRRRRLVAALTGALAGALLVPAVSSAIFPDRDAPRLHRPASRERLVRLFEERGFTVERGPAGSATILVSVGASERPVIVIMTADDVTPGISEETAPRSR